MPMKPGRASCRSSSQQNWTLTPVRKLWPHPVLMSMRKVTVPQPWNITTFVADCVRAVTVVLISSDSGVCNHTFVDAILLPSFQPDVRVSRRICHPIRCRSRQLCAATREPALVLPETRRSALTRTCYLVLWSRSLVSRATRCTAFRRTWISVFSRWSERCQWCRHYRSTTTVTFRPRSRWLRQPIPTRPTTTRWNSGAPPTASLHARTVPRPTASSIRWKNT